MTTLERKLRAYSRKRGQDLLILFGSRARGRSRKGSDVDLAIAGAGKPDLAELTDELIDLLHENDIDLIDLRRCDPLAGMQALDHGRVLFARRGALGEVASYVARRYADTAKFRRAADREIDLFLSRRPTR